MKNKKEAGIRSKILIIGIILISIISLIFLVSALTDNERASLQSELDNLALELSDSGYSWLIDYNLIYPSVEVHREDENESIADFGSIFGENWHKIYLTNLSENESYSAFDLKLGKYEKISYGIIQKKMRIDEIRKRLNQGGRNV